VTAEDLGVAGRAPSGARDLAEGQVVRHAGEQGAAVGPRREVEDDQRERAGVAPGVAQLAPQPVTAEPALVVDVGQAVEAVEAVELVEVGALEVAAAEKF
jgi:hypothetical protein